MDDLTIDAYSDAEAASVHRADSMLRTLYGAFRELATTCDFELPAIRVVIAEDLAAAVRDITGQSDFTGERLGGSVMGKAVSADPEWHAATIFMPAWLERSDDSWMPESILLAAHEFTHAFLGRMRGGEHSAAFDDQHDMARNARLIIQHAAEEVRADVLANGIIGHLSTLTTPEGETRPATTVDILGQVYAPQFGEVLDTRVYPGWPDLVDSYRNYEINLDTMSRTLWERTDQVMMLLAHTEAESINAEAIGPLKQFADHPGVEQYLGPVWVRVSELLDETPLIPRSPDELRSADHALAEIGRDEVLAMWRRLGVTGRATSDGSLWLDVTEPTR